MMSQTVCFGNTDLVMVNLKRKTLLLILLIAAGWIKEIRSNGCYGNDTVSNNATALHSFSVACLNTCTFCSLNQSKEIVDSFEDHATKQSYSRLCNRTLTLSDIQRNSTNQAVAALCIAKDWTRYPLALNALSRILVLDRNNINDLQFQSDNSNEKNTYLTNTKYQIEALSLQNNGLINISKDFFQDFRNLKVLILRHNRLTILNWTLGLQTSSLLILDLSYNKFSAINKNSLGTLPNLQKLDLSHNSISNIGSRSFASLPGLLHLDISFNHLVAGSILKNAFEELRNLTFLSLASNQKLSKLPLFDFAGLAESNLETLDLHKLTALTSIETFTFYGLQNLKKLNLSWCSLTDLSHGWLNGGPENSLKMLDLSSNRFQSIKPFYFVGIDERNSRLSCPQFKFYKMKYSNEKYIVLNYSPRFYRRLKNLTWLSLSQNFQLRTLDDNSFSFVPNLSYLFLQRCNISILNIPSLTLLFKDDAIHKTIPKLRGLWIFDNPLHCDCRIRNVISGSTLLYQKQKASNCSWLKLREKSNETFKFQVDSEQYYYENDCHVVEGAELSICFPFANSRGFELDNVPNSYLHCANEPMVLFVVMSIGPIVFFFGIALMLMCGFCNVLVRKLHRPYNYSGAYQPHLHHSHPLKKRPQVSTISFSSYGGSFAKRSGVRKRQSHSQHTSSNSSSKQHFQTNMVLTNFNSKKSDQHPRSTNSIRDERMGKSSSPCKASIEFRSVSNSPIHNRPHTPPHSSRHGFPSLDPKGKEPIVGMFDSSEKNLAYPSIIFHKEPPQQSEKKIRFIDEDSDNDSKLSNEETEFIIRKPDASSKSMNNMLTFI